MIDLQLADNVKAPLLEKSQKNKYREKSDDEPELRSQLAIYDFLKSVSIPAPIQDDSFIADSTKISAPETAPSSHVISEGDAPEKPAL